MWALDEAAVEHVFKARVVAPAEVTLESIERTVSAGLCVSCEICRAICPEEAIATKMGGGQRLPVVDVERCSGCGLCVGTCPGLRIDPHGIISSGLADEAGLAGSYRDCRSVKLKDGGLLARTASGGVVTGMALNLIEQGRYDFVSVLDAVGPLPGAPTLRFTSRPEEIIGAAKSKYAPASAHDIVKALDARRGDRFIVTATPCVADGIMRYARLRGIDLEHVLFIGLFCELTMSLNFIEYVRRRYGSPGEDIESLDYRNKLAGGWPGDMVVSFSSGRKAVIGRKERMAVKPYFMLERCLYCTDKLNRASDISVGDCYLKGPKDREGKSSVIIRTEKGQAAFSGCGEAFYTESSELGQIWVSQGCGQLQERVNRLRDTAPERGNGPDVTSRVGLCHEATSTQASRIRWGRELNLSRIRVDRIIRNAAARARSLSSYALAVAVFSWRVLADAPSLLLGKRPEYKGGGAVAIVGANFQNRGAQAMALTAMDEVRSSDPGTVIYMLVNDYEREPGKWNEFRVETVRWNGKSQLLQLCPGLLRNLSARLLPPGSNPGGAGAFKDVDAFIDVSGYALSSKWKWKNSVSYIANIMVAKKLGAAIELLPQSFGPWDYPKHVKPLIYPLLYLYLRYPTRICAREELGRQYIGKFSRRVELLPDIVLTGGDYGRQNILKPETCLRMLTVQESSVGIIPNARVFERLDPGSFFRIYDEAIAVVREQGRTALLLWYSAEDRLLCEKIYEMNRGGGGIELMSHDLNTIETEHVISQLDFIVTSRFHSIVHAYRNGVPAVALGWAHKYESLLEAFGQMDYMLDTGAEAVEENMRAALESMNNNCGEERVRIRSNLDAIRIRDWRAKNGL